MLACEVSNAGYCSYKRGINNEVIMSAFACWLVCGDGYLSHVRLCSVC